MSIGVDLVLGWEPTGGLIVVDLVVSGPYTYKTIDIPLNSVAAGLVKRGCHLVFQTECLPTVERLMGLVVVHQASLAESLVMIDRVVLLDDPDLVMPASPPVPFVVVQETGQARILVELQVPIELVQRLVDA
ncbi:MAG: hypothetical protein AABZ38_02405 [candidate division NC10 bacterium]